MVRVEIFNCHRTEYSRPPQLFKTRGGPATGNGGAGTMPENLMESLLKREVSTHTHTYKYPQTYIHINTDTHIYILVNTCILTYIHIYKLLTLKLPAPSVRITVCVTMPVSCGTRS